MGNVAPSFARIRALAATQWIPGDYLRGRTDKGQRNKDSQVAQIAFWATGLSLLLLQLGCQSTGGFPLLSTHRVNKVSKPSVADTQLERESDIAQVNYLQVDDGSTRRIPQNNELEIDDQDQSSETQPTLDNDSLSPEQDDAESGQQPGDENADSEDETSARMQALQSATSLQLNQVLASVAECYPEIEIAIGELETADGKVLASWGEFDQVFAAHSISQPLGFYQTYRNGVGLTRPLYQGGEVYGTYRIGDGNFEPWFGERETNEGGEFKAGFSLPFVKDRFIDERRANLFSSGFQRDQVESNIEGRLLQFQ